MEEIRDIVLGSRLCVLATLAGDRPYTSLMRYVANDACTKIYLITHQNTNKYRNILQNFHVSLLVDTRLEAPLQAISALSMDGIAVPVSDPEAQAALKERFVARHPDMEGFVRHPEMAVVCVEIQAFLLLNGIENARRIKVGT